MNLLNKLDDNLHNFENFHSEPFILFEKNNFLDSKDYKILTDEIYSYENFEKIFKGKGEKDTNQ